MTVVLSASNTFGYKLFARIHPVFFCALPPTAFWGVRMANGGWGLVGHLLGSANMNNFLPVATQSDGQSVEHLILVWSVHNVGQWTRHFPLSSLVTVPIRLYDIGACNSDHLNDNIECSTEVPAYSDTFGTRQPFP